MALTVVEAAESQRKTSVATAAVRVARETAQPVEATCAVATAAAATAASAAAVLAPAAAAAAAGTAAKPLWPVRPGHAPHLCLVDAPPTDRRLRWRDRSRLPVWGPSCRATATPGSLVCESAWLLGVAAGDACRRRGGCM